MDKSCVGGVRGMHTGKLPEIKYLVHAHSPSIHGD